MWHSIVLAVAVFAASCLPPGIAHSQLPSPEQIVRDAESAFRNIMEAWAYDQHWKMWEMGTRGSQFGITQNDFGTRMRLAQLKPAAGKQVEALQVFPEAPGRATVSVRFTLENRRRQLVQFVWNFPTVYEESAWRFDLNEFLKILSYQNY
jgi:hypothetical protein